MSCEPRRVPRALFLLPVVVALLFPALANGQSTNQTSTVEEDVPALVRTAAPSLVMVVLRDDTGRQLGTGSGFVVSIDGKVITNAHVIHIAGATEAEARFQDGSSYQTQGVVAVDSERDLAIIKLKATGRVFSPLRLGDSERVQVGQRVIAIGNPLAGLSAVNTESTVSDGIVSGIRDWPSGKMKVLQITAPLSPGSSGGPLLNTSGEVIGVTFAQLREGQNLNFAVPIDYASPLILTNGPLKSLAESRTSAASELTSPDPEVAPAGSYTGVWRSTRFAVSGAATITITIANGTATADIFLTGGEVKSARLSGSAQRTGRNIWTVELSSKRPRLSVRGIFRDNSFVGDYTYARFVMVDQGQWVLKKE